MTEAQRPVARPALAATRRPPRAARGFSIIEMVAILAIIAILAATITPGVMRQMDQAALTKERADLLAMTDAFQHAIRRNRAVTGHSTWAAALGDETQMGAAVVATTPRGFNRAFLVDPALRLAGANLPFTQTTNGTHQPISARVIILSSLAGALPVTSGVPSASEFNEIWNTASGARPASWTNYSGTGEDLVIQRVNLRPLFHRLVLINNDLAGTGRFSVDGSTAHPVPNTGTGWDTYYVDGTVIGLHGADGSLQCREILSGDASYVFEFGYWRGLLHEGRLRPSRGMQFAAAVQQFLNTPRNPGADFGGTQQAVVDQMYTYLFIYTLWAGDSPCFARHGSVNLQQVPHYQMLINAQTMLDNVSKNLLK
jgi:type II secretory pathway pseudopilin PulG